MAGADVLAPDIVEATPIAARRSTPTPTLVRDHSGAMRVTAYASYAVAGFCGISVWAVIGFALSAEPLPLALSAVSKILCLVAAIMLFIWGEDGEVSGAGYRS